MLSGISVTSGLIAFILLSALPAMRVHSLGFRVPGFRV